MDEINYDRLLIFIGKWLVTIDTNIEKQTNKISKENKCITVADLFFYNSYNDNDNYHINYKKLFEQLIIEYIYSNGLGESKYINVRNVLGQISLEKIDNLILLYKLFR